MNYRLKVFGLVLTFLALAGCTADALSPAAPAAATATNAPAEPAATNTPIPTLTASPTSPPATATEVPPPTATATPAVYGPDNFPSYINPLTGLPINVTSLLDRRPVAVKVQLYPRGQRPVVGVSKADLVFDFYQNNGLTRLHAIFYGQDAEQAGPVRSARLFDDELIQMYKSIFAFGGASASTLDELFNSGYEARLVLEGDGKCPALCRSDPNGFNFLMADTAALTNYTSAQGVDNVRQPLDGMLFTAAVPAGGQPGMQLTTRYSISAYSRWDYDSVSGRYLRSQDTQDDDGATGEAYAPLIDGLTGQTVAADNVVVLLMEHKIVDPAANSKVIEVHSYGSGPAYVFRDGQVFQATWNRPEPDSTLYLTGPDGAPFPLKPGNTWFQVTGVSSRVEPQEAGGWRVTFVYP